MRRDTKLFLWMLVAAASLLWSREVPAQDAVDQEIAQLNAVLRAEGLPWTAGRTAMSDLSPEQRRALLGGPMEPLRHLTPTYSVLEEQEDIPEDYTGGVPPASWDWRSKDGINWMTPVTDQHCGDCWAHATCGSMEVRLRWQKGGTYGYELPIDLAERYAVSCSPHGSCSPWNVPSLLDFIQSEGVPDELCLPYNASLTCADRCANWNVRVLKVTSHGTYNGPSDTFRTNVMDSCYLNGPIAVWMMVYSDFWDYSGGIYVKSGGAAQEGGHFVNIVGWGTSGGTPYWICKNSWGTGWGVSGYFYIRRGTNESRMEEQAYWLTPQNIPNLTSSTPSGWSYPLVPRGNSGATAASCVLPATLPGNSNSTYWNVNWKNTGTVQARDNVTHLTVDGDYWHWFSISFQPVNYETKHINYGPQLVRGGRHTLCMDAIDDDNRVWEFNERDNTYCRQFIWSPYALPDNSPVTRSSPPRKDSLGYTYFNCDGFSFQVQAVHPDAWWSAVGVLPSNASADYDIRLHDIGTYTGSESGFGSSLKTSSWGGSASDFVIVNDNMATAGTYYAGVLNYNQGSGDYRIEEDASEKIYPRPGTPWNGTYSKNSTNVLDIYEVYLSAGTYYFLLDQTAGTCDLGMTLYDDETVTAGKSDFMSGGYANSSGDGGDEAFEIDIPDSGFHGLAVWKVDASDYAKTSTYRIAAGPPAITVGYPNGGETFYIGSSYDLTWESFGLNATIGSNVRIEISRDGGSIWSTLLASTPNDGVQPWTVTSPASTQCRIRVTSTTNGAYTDLSNGNFAIQTPGALSVTPGDGLNSAGMQGGPFSPDSLVYTLQNTGDTSIDWTASKTQSWTTLSATSGTLAAGANTAVTVSINSNALSLTPGSYQDPVSFTNTTNGSGNTTRPVSLTVNALPGALAVDPGDGLVSSGFEGGPFTPGSLVYTLENTGGSPLDWTVSNLRNWTTLSAESGSLAAGANTTVTVSINAYANTLAPGVRQDTISFTNTTNGLGNTTRTVSLTVTALPRDLVVTPGGSLASSGPQGGPFRPESLVYTLENTGAIPINWTAAKTQNWVTLSAENGTLAVGANTTVTVSINSNANALALGYHQDPVSFTNTTNGSGNTTRSATLTVRRSKSPLNPGILLLLE